MPVLCIFLTTARCTANFNVLVTNWQLHKYSNNIIYTIYTNHKIFTIVIYLREKTYAFFINTSSLLYSKGLWDPILTVYKISRVAEIVHSIL